MQTLIIDFVLLTFFLNKLWNILSLKASQISTVLVCNIYADNGNIKSKFNVQMFWANVYIWGSLLHMRRTKWTCPLKGQDPFQVIWLINWQTVPMTLFVGRDREITYKTNSQYQRPEGKNSVLLHGLARPKLNWIVSNSITYVLRAMISVYNSIISFMLPMSLWFIALLM